MADISKPLAQAFALMQCELHKTHKLSWQLDKYIFKYFMTFRCVNCGCEKHSIRISKKTALVYLDLINGKYEV